MSSSKQTSGLAKKIVQKLVSKGIKLLALDFDHTIIDIHTFGFWQGGPEKLVEHVRPCFKALLPAAINSDLHVAIVTFSSQVNLIQELLHLCLPKCDLSKVVIRGSTETWGPVRGVPMTGKLQHIASVQQALAAPLKPHQVLLMDDDKDNVENAARYGHRAMLVAKDVSIQHVYDWVLADPVPEVGGVGCC